MMFSKLIMQEGALGLSVCVLFHFLVRFFGFRTLKLRYFFRFWCPARFAGFLQFSLWFSIIFTPNDGGCSDFSIRCILRFFCFVFFQGSYMLKSDLNGNSQRPLTQRSTLSFRGMDDKLSPFAAVTWNKSKGETVCLVVN